MRKKIHRPPFNEVHGEFVEVLLNNAVNVALNSVESIAPFRSGEDYGGWWNVSRYAREIQAMRQDRDRKTITAIGRMLLELAGREAVKWLLHVEVALSTGSNDPWRVDRWTLQILASRDPSKPLNTLRLKLETGHALSTASLERLAALGLLQVNNLGALGAESRSDTLLEKANERSYRVLPHARRLVLFSFFRKTTLGIIELFDSLSPFFGEKHQPPSSILGEFAEGRDTPMSILVQALLEDEVRGLLPAEQAVPATTATIRQARLIVHEIGHTVTPVQVALESIARTARAAGIADQIADPLRRANLALDRLRSFSNKLDELAQLAGEVPGVFDAETALHEAVRMGRPETGHVPATSLPKRLPHLLGVRERFVLALVNLLRNAYQAAPADSPTMAVTVELEQSRMHVTVDDNGPGVPPAERERIFLDGYSTRAGGSGRGLALSRAIIEKDMHGSLTCEDGSSMGARASSSSCQSMRRGRHEARRTHSHRGR